jgi:TP901 family phage tail tape measure protein
MDQVDLEFRLKTEKADASIAETARKGRDLFEKKGFKLNIKTGNLPLGRITGDFEKFQGSLDAATARVLAFTATTSVIYGLSSAFTRLFTDSVKLEKQLASIQAILQTSNNNLKQFSDELFKVANTTGQSFDVAASAASEFARQGLSVEETLKATTSALVFSKIAGVDAAQAVENLTASINTFGNEALSYTDVVDTIVSLDNAFAISAGGIADGLKRVGSVASESGIQLKEIASLISVVQQVSARGAPVISNGLKTIFTRLGRQQVQESLNGIGVATQSANGEFRSQIDILTDLSNKLNTLSDSQRAFILEQVAGVYQINTLQATLKSLSGEYSLYDKAVKVASDSAGNAADRLKILTDTTDANLQRLKNNVTQFLAEVGGATVKPLLDNFVGIGNKILETLNLGAAGKEGEEAGISIGSFLLNGISSVLSGPGTILIVATVGKLLGKITKDALSALQTLSGLKQASLVDSQTQKSINDAIAQGNKALVDRLATTTSIVKKTEILNKLLSDMAAKQGVAQVNQAVSAGLAANKRGVSPKVRSKGYIPTYSDGFIPEYLQKAEKKGTQLGGYSGKGVMLSSTGKVMSKAESEVFFPNFKESAIMPPPYSMAGRSYRKAFIQKHDMDPYEQQTASKGFIPNFAAAKNVLKRADQLGPKVIERANPQDTFQARINPVEMTSTVQELRKKSKDILDKVYVRTKDRKAGEKGYNENALEGFENEYSSKSNKALLSRTSTFIKNIGSRGNRLRSNSSGYIEALNQIQGLLGEVEAKESFKDKSGKTKFTEGFSYFDLITENADGSQSFSEVRARAKINSLDILKKAVNQNVLENNYKNKKTDNVKLGNYDVLIPKGSAFNSFGFIPNFASRYTEARKQKRDELRASLFNIGDFAGGAIKNVNAQTEFNKARDKNPNVEWDDKINQVGFKVERIPISDREFEAALRSKENNKEVTTKFENYAIDYLSKKGYSFKPGRDTLYGKENAAVDGYNIKQNFIELLEVKGGGWDAPDVNNKFGRFTPENLVDLGPQLVSKFFKEGNPDPNINDKIRIRNVLAIPNLIGGVFKKNIAPQYPSADVEKIEKARQRTRPSGQKIPANKLWMLGVVEGMKNSGMTNASGFIPNFASRLSYKETQKAQKEAIDREVASGQRRKDVKVGKSNSLRTALNPMGFGVFNKDEKTLANGISLAKKEGIDPRSKGMFASDGFIPNFAESPYIKAFGQNASPQQMARFEELYIKNVEARKAAGKMGVKGGMDTKKSEKRNQKYDATRAVKQIYQEEGVKRGNQSKAKPKPAPQNPESRISIPKPESRLSITTPVNPGVSTPSQGVNTDNLKQATGRVVEKRQPRQTGPTVIPSGDTIPMSGPTGRSPQEQAKRDRQAKALRRQRAASRNQNTGAAGAFASLAIPGIVGGLLPEEGKRNQGQQAVADVAESTSSGMMAASMVGMIPKLAKFGPVVGVAVGAVMLLSKSAKNAVPSIKGLQEENDKLLASNEKQVTSLNEAVAKQEEVSQLRASGADPKKIARAQLDFAKSVSNIGDSGLKTTLLTEKDETKKQEAVMQFQEKKKKEADFSQGVLAAATMSRNEGVQRASGGAGTLSYATSLLAKGAGAIGFKSGERALNEKAEEIKGPKKDFDASQSEAILNPIINSLDLSKASSKEASEGIKDLASGTIDMATFIEKFGKELGLSSTQVASARDTFKGLSENFSPESLKGLNEYAGGLLKINSSIQQQLARPPVVNVNFQKVLDKALQNLTFDTALTNYKNFANATANLDIEESQLTIDQQLGRVSPEEMVRKKSELTGRRERQGFEEKSSAILDEAVQGVLALVPKNLDQKTQSSILSAAKSSLTQGGDITVLQDTIRQSLGASEDSNKILEQIEALNQKSVQSLEMLNVDMATAEKVRQAQTEQQIAAIQSQNNKNLGDRALAGDVGSQFSLLDPVAASKLEKEISDLRDKATKAGVGTEAGKKYSAKAEAKNLELNQMRDEARKAEMETFGKEYTSAVDSTGLGAQMGQSAETDYIVSMVEKLSTAYARETGTTGISETSKEQIRASLMSGDKAAAKGILESQGAIGGREGTDRKALSDEVLKFLNQTRTPSTPQGAAAGGAPAAAGGAPATGAGMPTPQMPGVSVPGATSATGGPAAVGSPSATGAAIPQISGSNIPSPSSTVSPSMSALARLRDNTMLERVGQENLLEQAANEKTIQEAQEAVKQADTDAANLATFESQRNEAGLNLRKSISSETAQEKFRALSENVGKIQTTSYIPSGPGFGSSNYAVSGSMTVDKEAAARKQQLQDFLSRAQEGKATKQEFEAIKASVTGEGAKGKSELDLKQTRSFIKEIESLGVPENLIDATAYTDEKQKALAEKSKRSEQQAKLKNAAAVQAKTRIEDLAADPTGTFEFLKDDKQKQAAVAKFKKSKDPKLEALGKKIEEDDANKKRLEEAKKLTEERKVAFGQTVEDVRMGLSQDLSQEDTAAANEALNKFKKGEINIDDESLKKYGLDQQLKQTDVQFKQQNYQDALKAQEAARNKSLASGKAVKDMGRGAVGAVNNAIYGDQVTPGIMQMVKDPEGQKAIKAYNASVVERDAKREQLSGIDASLQEAQSADTLRQQAASKVKSDLSKNTGYGSNLKPEDMEQYDQTQYALNQYRSGKIDIKDKSLDSVRSQLIQAAGGEEKFNEMNAKSGKTKDLQTQREQIAKELASGESKTAQLETMMMEYLKTVTGAANQRDTAQTMGPDGKPKEEGTSTQQSTTEKREVTSNVNIKIEGTGITPEMESRIIPIIVAEVQKINRENSMNSGQSPPVNGPAKAVA